MLNMKNRIIVGITAFKHDSSAAIIKNGELIAFSEEERFNRQKNTSELPKYAVRYCLNEANIASSDVTDIAFYFSKKLSLISYITNNNPISWLLNIKKLTNRRFFYELFWVINFYIKANALKFTLGMKNAKIHYIPHHEAHVWYGIYASKQRNGIVISNDSIGESVSTLCSEWKIVNDKVTTKRLLIQKDPHSIGYLYGAITEYLGFNRKNGSGKVMALASFGTNRYSDFFHKNIKLYDNGIFKISNNILLDRSYKPSAQRLSDIFYKIFGENIITKNHDSQDEFDLANSLQEITEKIVINQIKYLSKINKNIVITGGVAQNSVVNGKLVNLFKDCNFFVPPIPNDAGCSIGAAVYLYHKYYSKLPKYTETAFLGEKFDCNHIKNILINSKIKYKEISDIDSLINIVITNLINKRVVSIFNDKMECGPRALGIELYWLCLLKKA